MVLHNVIVHFTIPHVSMCNPRAPEGPGRGLADLPIVQILGRCLLAEGADLTLCGANEEWTLQIVATGLTLE